MSDKESIIAVGSEPVVTGISFVDKFVAAVPAALFHPEKELEPIWFAFDSGGKVTVISPDGNPGSRDDDMDVRATWVIAYVKTYHPVALVMVSEMFVRRGGPDEPTPEPVNCSRFTNDAAYREEILRDRREFLSLIIETSRGSQVIGYPIIRTQRPGRNDLRTLGPTYAAQPQSICGRFTHLLSKSNAMESVVQTAMGFDGASLDNKYPEETRRQLIAAILRGEQIQAGNPTDGGLNELWVRERDIFLIFSTVNDRILALAVNAGHPLGAAAYRSKCLEIITDITGVAYLLSDLVESETANATARLAGAGAIAFFLPTQLEMRTRS